MKFLSIDSSLANTGIAIGHIDENDVITVDKIMLSETKKSKHKTVRASSDTILRCRQTYNFIHYLITQHKPDIIIAETPSGSQNASGMKSYGATCQLIGSLNPTPIEVTPQEVKMATVGKKTASKTDMINWAVKNYPDVEWLYHAKKLQNKNEHMADAIAIAHAALNTRDYSMLKQILKK